MTKKQPKISNQKYQREEYISRINRVFDYIESHIDNNLSLEELAKIANFSAFHFHRIFSAMVGETLNQFIQRVRIEKAAALLISNPKISITEIAFDCGFSGSATFARAFKEAYSMNASQWRAGGYKEFRNICKGNSKNSKTVRKNRKDFNNPFLYFDGVNETNFTVQNQKGRLPMLDKKELQVKVKDMEEFHVAYVRNIGPYKGNSELFENLFNKLMKWAGPRGLLQFPDTKTLVVYHDNPEITDEEKLRISACITISEDTPIDGKVGKMVVSGGKYAMAHFELKTDEFQEAWNSIFADWLPDSGYQPDDRPCFELYHNNCKEHPEQISILDICIPVKPL